MDVEELSFEPVDPKNTHMTWEEFVDQCERRSLIDEDGFADLATSTEVSNMTISPSQIRRSRGSYVPPWATHVVWYNK